MDIFCPQCRLEQSAAHRYCVRCGSYLPSELVEGQQAKRVRMFPGIQVHESDPAAAYLRVSCYLKEQRFEAPEGSVVIPGRHVRFSIWTDVSAQCVISVPEAEARDLAAFVLTELDRPMNGTLVNS